MRLCSPIIQACELRSMIGMIPALTLAAALVTQTSPVVGPVTVRGKVLTVRYYGSRAGQPVVVSSGDGGWIHLAPHVAGVLARAGYFVVGIDSREYLSAFTSGQQGVHAADEPGDYRTFAALAAGRGPAKPILIGVSEGAGLSVLASIDPATKAAIAGVVALGLPDVNELGWRWKDAIIYITKGVPGEPTFSVAGIIDRVAPLPLAAIHSTGDEFVPVSVIQRLMARAHEPKKLWLVEASNHRFSGNETGFDLRLIEACDWIRSLAGPRGAGPASAVRVPRDLALPVPAQIDAVALSHAVERPAIDAHDLRGSRAVALDSIEDVHEVAPLDVVETRQTLEHLFFDARRPSSHPRREVGDVDHRTPAEEHQPLDGVFQFAHVPGP
jgi:hypothetical protein